MNEMQLLKVLENDPRATITDLADILQESKRKFCAPRQSWKRAR